MTKRWRAVVDSQNTLPHLQKQKWHLLSAYCVPFTLLFILTFSLSPTTMLRGMVCGLGICSNEAAQVERVSVTCLRSQPWVVGDMGTKLGSDIFCGKGPDSAFHLQLFSLFPGSLVDSHLFPYVLSCHSFSKDYSHSEPGSLEYITRCSCMGSPVLCVIMSMWDMAWS